MMSWTRVAVARISCDGFVINPPVEPPAWFSAAMDQPTKRGKRGSEKQLDHFNYRDEEDAEAAEPGSWQKADEARRPRHAHAMHAHAMPTPCPRHGMMPSTHTSLREDL